MNIIEDRQQRAAENILGNERLTADLDDEAAEVLLAWGLDWTMETVLQTAAMEEEQAQYFLSPRLKALRRMLRQINIWIRDRDSHSFEEQAERLAKIYQQALLAQGYPTEDKIPQQVLNLAIGFHGEAKEQIEGLRSLLDEEQE